MKLFYLLILATIISGAKCSKTEKSNRNYTESEYIKGESLNKHSFELRITGSISYIKMQKGNSYNHYYGRIVQKDLSSLLFILTKGITINLCKKDSYGIENIEINTGEDSIILNFLEKSTYKVKGEGKYFETISHTFDDGIINIDLSDIETRESQVLMIPIFEEKPFEIDTLFFNTRTTAICMSSKVYFDTLDISIGTDTLFLKNHYKFHKNLKGRTEKIVIKKGIPPQKPTD
jgi:hypothetical protein